MMPVAPAFIWGDGTVGDKSMKNTVTTAAALVAVLGSGLASAAVIEEIVVTAQKREQNVQDVGIAISALSGEQMRELGYTNAQQVTAMAPAEAPVRATLTVRAGGKVRTYPVEITGGTVRVLRLVRG